MRILLTNDDGINARGLHLLETLARTFSDDIWVVAPTEEQAVRNCKDVLRECGSQEDREQALTLLNHLGVLQ